MTIRESQIGWPEGRAWEVHCPACGTECTHHGKVTVFNREEDDSRGGTRAVVEGQNVEVSRDASRMAGNPSSRRDGLIIEFRCEGCDWVSELRIFQHKGNTYLMTRPVRTEKWSADQ